MKKYLKIVLCFMAFAVCSFMLAFSPTMSAYMGMVYAAYSYSTAIDAIKMPTTVNVAKGESFNIPLLNSYKGGSYTNYSIIVYDITGCNSHEYNMEDSSKRDTNFFNDNNGSFVEIDGHKHLQVKALNNGNYKVEYIVRDAGKTYISKSYKVEVTNVTRTIDFVSDSGLKQLVKTEVATGSEKIKLPIAKTRVEGQESLTADVVPSSVALNGVEQVLDATDSAFTKVGGDYFLNPKEEGTYVVSYKYTSGERKVEKISIKVTDNFVEPTKVEVMSSQPSMPTVELGKKDNEFKTLTFKNVFEDGTEETNVACNVTKIEIVKESNSSIKQTLTNNTFKFDMTTSAFGVENYADLVGNYNVTFYFENAYGKTNSLTKRLGYVDATSNSLNVYMAYDYELEDANDESKINTDYEVELRKTYGYDELVVPAIYATDWLEDSNLILIRELYNTDTSTTYYVDNKKYDQETGELKQVNEGEVGYNYSTDDKAYNKATAFKFVSDDSTSASDHKGNYQLRYRVISKNVKERVSKLYVSNQTYYTFKVSADATVTDTTIPEIELGYLEDSYKSNEDITITLTASDESTKVKSAVFYYFGATKTNEVVSSAVRSAISATTSLPNYKKTENILYNESFISTLGYTQVKESETKGSYVLNLAETTQPSANIVAVTIDADGNIAVATKTISVKNMADTTIPTYSVEDAGDLVEGSDISNTKEYNQNVTVNLPTVKFSDSVDSVLSTGVYYYVLDAEGNRVVENGAMLNQKLDANTVVGGQIKTSEVGTYYVVYTANDAAGNANIVYFTFTVVDSSKPSITPDATGKNITRTGNTITAVEGAEISFSGKLTSSNGKTVLADKIDSIVVSNNGEALRFEKIGENKYAFYDAGTYTVKFNGAYSGIDAEEKVLYVSISKPTLEWNGTFTVQEYAKQNSEVILPVVSATYGYRNADVVVSVKTPGGANVEVTTRVAEDGYSEMVFKTAETTKGTYKVTYTAEIDGKKIEKEFSIKVGDNSAPVISMNHEAELKQDIVYDGEHQLEYALDVSKSNKTFVVSVKSNGNTIYSYDLGLNISDKDDLGVNNPNYSWYNLDYKLTGNNVTGSNNKYYINGTGKCTLTLTIKDNYDNETTKVINFNVVSETKTEEKNDTVVGVVLIVISLIVLAGVILFFTFTGKSGKGKGKTTKQVKTTKDTQAVEDKTVIEEKSEVEQVKEVVSEQVEQAKEVEQSEQETETSSQENTTENE